MKADRGATEAPYPRTAYAWTVVGVLFCTAVISYTDRQVLSLLIDPVRAELRLGDGQMALLLGTAFALVYGIAGVPAGWLADRTSRRNLIAAGVLVWGLGTVFCGLAHSFSALFAARIVVGLGEAVLSPAAISLISDLFPERRRGAAVGLYFTGIAIGVGGSIFIGGALLGGVRTGLLAWSPVAAWPLWRQVFLAIGAPSLLWALVILLIGEPPRHAQAPSAKAAPPARRTQLALAPVYVVVAIASLVDNAVGAWAPSLLIRRFAADPALIGLQLGLGLMLGYGGGMLAGGLLADRARSLRGPRGKLELCLLAALAVLPTSLLLDSPAAAGVLVGAPVYFFLSAVVTASGLSAILDATPNRTRGVAMAVSFFLNVAVGAGLGPILVTAAAAGLFPHASLGPPLVITAVGAYVLATVAAVAALKIRPHDRHAFPAARP